MFFVFTAFKEKSQLFWTGASLTHSFKPVVAFFQTLLSINPIKMRTTCLLSMKWKYIFLKERNGEFIVLFHPPPSQSNKISCSDTDRTVYSFSVGAAMISVGDWGKRNRKKCVGNKLSIVPSQHFRGAFVFIPPCLWHIALSRQSQPLVYLFTWLAFNLPIFLPTGAFQTFVNDRLVVGLC